MYGIFTQKKRKLTADQPYTLRLLHNYEKILSVRLMKYNNFKVGYTT